MEPLGDVIAFLRFEGREDLSALLADAYVDFEYLDTVFSITGDAELQLTNANIYAPISASKTLRELSKGDKDLILDSLREVWPVSESGGMVIQSVSYTINKESLSVATTHLFTSPIGWQRVDRTMDRIRELLVTASTEEQYQEVGVLCREGLISWPKPSLTRSDILPSPTITST